MKTKTSWHFFCLYTFLILCFLAHHQNGIAKPSLDSNYNDSFDSVIEETVLGEAPLTHDVTDMLGEPVQSNNVAFTVPDASNIDVNDYANLLDNKSIQALKKQLQTVNANHGIEMTLITINDLSTFNAGPEIESFAAALFNHWGVGDANKNDGVLLLVARNDQKMRIEVGRSYEPSWGSVMK